MTQNITVQIGQCGNQIGCRFWDLALREHSFVNKKGTFDEALNTFFRNVDTSRSNIEIPFGRGIEKIRSLKARAVLIDTEEGVVNEVMKGPLGEVFDHRQYVTDVSGAGNNWACGHYYYGTKYHDSIQELVRKNAEHCDSLESFFIMHSMGGGTGSGLGTAVLKILEDEYKDVHRFVVAVYPSVDDDVVTSPYNCVLATKQLTDHADCVIPIDNQSLINIVNTVESAANPDTNRKGAGLSSRTTTLTRNASIVNNIISNAQSLSAQKKCEKPFDSMNNIVANMLLNLTSSTRFEGSLNIDLNEITMNLVPFPRMHYLISSLSPLYISENVNQQVRGIEQMFSDAFKRDNQLLQCEPRSSLYLACALILRGKVNLSDIRSNIEKYKKQLKFIRWNEDGWKTGLCSVAPFGQPYSLLTLANNTCIKDTFSHIQTRFNKLYKRKAHVHHYTEVEGMDSLDFDESINSLNDLIGDYSQLEKQNRLNEEQADVIKRLKILS